METLKLDKIAATLLLKDNGFEGYKLPSLGRTLFCEVPFICTFSIKKIDKNIFEYCTINQLTKGVTS